MEIGFLGLWYGGKVCEVDVSSWVVIALRMPYLFRR